MMFVFPIMNPLRVAFLNRSERWAEQRAQKKYELQIHTQRNIMHETFILQRFMCINALIFQYLQRSGKNETLINRKRLDSSIYLYNTNKYGLYLPVWRTSFST